jgi:hypothetical protein
MSEEIMRKAKTKEYSSHVEFRTYTFNLSELSAIFASRRKSDKIEFPREVSNQNELKYY